MKVKHHALVAGLVDDPAEYAVRAGLVNKHDEAVFAKVGAWRWPLVSKHRDAIVPMLDGYAIDLGGAAAPVGYGAVVVDYQNPHDQPRSLLDVPPGADCVFCSHTLEHFVDLDLAMCSIWRKLKVGGHLVLQVPSWRKAMLRAENWDYHEQTFCLTYETNAPARYIRLDALLEAWRFTVTETDMIGDNILVMATR